MKTTHVCSLCSCLYVYDTEADNEYEDVCEECVKKIVARKNIRKEKPI